MTRLNKIFIQFTIRTLKPEYRRKIKKYFSTLRIGLGRTLVLHISLDNLCNIV